jgi:Flp pilus assembly protein TadG
MTIMTLSKIAQRLTTSAARLKGDAKGVAAVEFALIFPIMLALYLGSIEISGALQANKNIGKTASTVADLITQQDDITKAEFRAIAEIGEAMLFPYTETKPLVEVVGIRIDNSPTPKAIVEWSQRYNNGALSRPIPPGQEITIPANLLIPNTFLVRGSADLKYKPLVTWSTQSGGIMNMSETYYLRPRLSSTITCADC